MAKATITLKAEPRTEQGSVPAGRLRRAGYLPAAVNRIEGGTTMIKLNSHAFEMAMRGQTSRHLLVALDLEGQSVAALLREIQNDVITGKPIHVDFGEVSMAEKIRVQVPLRLQGEPEGVRVGNGVLAQVQREIEVECLPTDLVEVFDVDVSGLGVGQSLFVRDLKLGEAFTILTGQELAVASVTAPEQGDDDVEEEGEESPKVIAKGKKDEAAGAATKS